MIKKRKLRYHLKFILYFKIVTRHTNQYFKCYNHPKLLRDHIMKFRFFVIRLFLVVYLPLISYSNVAYAKTIIRFHHDMAIDSALHKGAVIFQREVEKLSKGEMLVQIYPANTLGDDQYSTELLQVGIIQLAVIPTSKLANFSPSLKALDYPYLFNDRPSVYKVLDGEIGHELLNDMQSEGITGLGFWESGFKQITCNDVFSQHEQRNESPLKGVPVRIMASDVLKRQYLAAGALPLAISFSEIYVALQHGLAKCQENPIVSIAITRIYEVQNELLLSNHGYLGYAFIASSRWFNELNNNEKQLIRTAENIARDKQREASSQLEKNYLKEILKSGKTQVVSSDFNQDLRARFVQVKAEKNIQVIIDKIRGLTK